ncbi:OmpA family protein [Vibrio sp.]|uniref:OmpA family protein n=1 Tax=Vibrio sp. TaxID=678 RepID=UPI003D14D67A
MKYIALPLLLLLTGCSNMSSEARVFGGNMLDTAPSDAELRHPEWGYANRQRSAAVKVTSDAKREYTPQPNTQQAKMSLSEYNSLATFLRQNGVDYEVLPGNHVMVRLKNTIHFNTGSAKVSADSNRWLNTLSRYLSRQPDIDVVIDGHTDSVGKAQSNDRLSVNRANAVKQQLMRNNVDKNSIFTRGYGEYVPACTNQNASGKACNRRVELVLIVQN